VIASLFFAAISQAATIDALLDRIVAWKLTPSVSVAVVENARVAYAGASGNADLDDNRPASLETPYRIGELGRLFLAVASRQLETAGKPKSQGVEVDDDALRTRIERAAGVTLGTYLEEHVFRPAGMTNTWLDAPGERSSAAAAGYYEWRDVFALAASDNGNRCCSFFSTATDLARFDAALLNGILIPTASLQTLSPFELHTLAGMEVIGAQGSPSGFDATDVVVPAQHFAIVTLANCAGFSADAVLYPIITSLYPQAVTVHPLSYGMSIDKPANEGRLRALLAAQSTSLGGVRGMSLLSTSVSAGFVEYRYLVDFEAETKSVFFVIGSDGKVDGLWLH
jgi:CubicO group peptidase (beta-lactamase class C family)